MKSEWVAVKKRLPEEDGSYLVDTENWNDVIEAYFISGTWKDFNGSLTGLDITENVRFWMPKPPKAKA